MYNIFCDVCEKQITGKQIVRITAERMNGVIRERKEICDNCYEDIFLGKKQKELEEQAKAEEIKKLNKLAGIKCD